MTWSPTLCRAPAELGMCASGVTHRASPRPLGRIRAGPRMAEQVVLVHLSTQTSPGHPA